MNPIWQRWFLVAGLTMVAVGLVIAFLGAHPWAATLTAPFHEVFWPGGAVPNAARHFQRFIYGVLGGSLAGWGVFLVFLARTALARGEQWAWRCAAAGFGLWFVIDTGLSAATGVTANVLFNVAAATLIAVPLAGSYRDLRGRWSPPELGEE